MNKENKFIVLLIFLVGITIGCGRDENPMMPTVKKQGSNLDAVIHWDIESTWINDNLYNGRFHLNFHYLSDEIISWHHIVANSYHEPRDSQDKENIEIYDVHYIGSSNEELEAWIYGVSPILDINDTNAPYIISIGKYKENRETGIILEVVDIPPSAGIGVDVWVRIMIGDKYGIPLYDKTIYMWGTDIYTKFIGEATNTSYTPNLTGRVISYNSTSGNYIIEVPIPPWVAEEILNGYNKLRAIRIRDRQGQYRDYEDQGGYYKDTGGNIITNGGIITFTQEDFQY